MVLTVHKKHIEAFRRRCDIHKISLSKTDVHTKKRDVHRKVMTDDKWYTFRDGIVGMLDR